jgi:hypothetical protein
VSHKHSLPDILADKRFLALATFAAAIPIQFLSLRLFFQNTETQTKAAEILAQGFLENSNPSCLLATH